MEDSIGIMIYGYHRDDALKIQAAIEPAVENPLIVISASGREDWLVADILDKSPEDLFEDKEAKIIMFLGFNEGQVKASLRDFPSPEVTRPIFCSLTVHNMKWPLQHLIDHLQEEHRQWTQKGSQPPEEA
jgi:hypothetical protein